MRRVASVFVATLALISLSAIPVHALDVVAGSPALTDGPLLITKYSFQGDQLRFVELYNDSDDVVDLAGWSLIVNRSSAPVDKLIDFSGLLPPRAWVTVGDRAAFATDKQPTFSYSYQRALSSTELDSISLQSPGNYLAQLVKPAISSTTVHLATTPPTYGFQRNQSTVTGNYTSSYRAVLPDTSFQPFDDGLYVRPSDTSLQVVEIYPNPATCSPLVKPQTEPLCFDYVKLYNPTTTAVSLGDFRLRSANYSAITDQLLPAGSYVVLSISLNNSGWVWLEDRYGLGAYEQSLVEYPDSGTRHGQAWSFDGTAWRWTRYPTPYDGANQFTDGQPVNNCADLRLSEIGANRQAQFIEIYNSSTEDIQLDGCQLTTNRSDTARYIFANQSLAPAALLAVDVATTDLVLTKTTSGTVYILSSDGMIEVDSRTYENLDQDTSLALVDGVWRQTFTATPGTVNQFAAYPPCQDGYWRNTETGRCNQVAVRGVLADCGTGRERNPTTGRCRAVAGASLLTPCQSGQVRNPATNRCRSATPALSTLTPCRQGQARNPATNRCRSIVAANSTLKPCAADQERNPSTNRCRRVATASAGAGADFPVEPIADTGQAFAAWWALGGVLLLGAGYGTWEWRHEIRRLVQQAVTWSRFKQ